MAPPFLCLGRGRLVHTAPSSAAQISVPITRDIDFLLVTSCQRDRQWLAASMLSY